MENVQKLIGNTPLVEIPHRGNKLYLKMEASNPGLSIKDRVAFYVSEELEKSIGLSDKEVVEYSSGNLAIGLAQASKIWNFKLTLVVTSKTSADKIRLLQRYGVRLIMVNEDVHSEDELGFRGFAEKVAQVRRAIFIDQFHNPLNAQTHRMTTGPEIAWQMPDADYVFAPMGTGGTASGIAQHFKDIASKTEVVGVTPNSGIYYTRFHGLRDDRGPVKTTIEGVGEDFIPGNLKMELLGNIVEVRDKLAIKEVEWILEKTGLFVGGSSGMALAAAKSFARDNKLRGKKIIVLCPDSGNRYLSNFKMPTKQENGNDSDYAELVRKYQQGDYPKIVE